MNILKLFVTVPASFLLIFIVCMFEAPLTEHIEIGTKNLYSVSETFKNADLYVRELHKEHDVKINSAFR